MTTTRQLRHRTRCNDTNRPGPPPAQIHRQLLTTAEKLASEFTGLQAGSVIRCFARAVHEVRMAGVPAPAIAVEAEQLTRRLLHLRETPRPCMPHMASSTAQRPS